LSSLISWQRRARRAIARADDPAVALTLARFYVLAAIGRVRKLRSPVRAMGMTLHFVDFEALLVVFEEMFARQPYAVDDLPARPLIVDCGANVGMSILYFKRRYPDAEIV